MRFLINMDKSSLGAQQKFIYLGLVWDTTKWVISLKPEREESIRKLAQWIAAEGLITCQLISRLIGKVQSTHGAVPLTRTRVR